MNRITLALVAAVGLCVAGAAFAETDRERDGLVGPVKSVVIQRTETRERDDQSFASEPIPVAEVGYDRNGFRTVIRRYDRDGEVSQVVEMTYSDPGELASEVSSSRRGEADGSWTYRRNGDQVIATFVDADGAAGDTRTMLKDSAGQVVEDRVHHPDGTEHKLRTARYDEQGRLIESKRWEYGKFEGSVEKGYDEAGRLVSELRRDSFDRPYSRSVFEYDDAGNLVRLQEYRWAGLDQEELLFNDFRYSYEYDQHGNWTKRVDDITYRSPRDRMVTAVETAERLIEYYESDS